MNSVIGIIPARYNSSRFPGKALADIGGKSMIRRVYERASLALDHVVVATDDDRIFEHVAEFGEAIMTAKNHQSGTDRCSEASRKIADPHEYVINIQGDEPFIDPAEISRVRDVLINSGGSVEIATLSSELPDHIPPDDPNTVKLVVNRDDEAIYFSRSPIPYNRSGSAHYLQHVGLYAYREDILQDLAKLEPGHLEKTESLEQLRWIENGYTIKVIPTQMVSVGIDTREELEEALKSKIWQVN